MCMVHSNKLTKELIKKAIKAKKPLKMYKVFEIYNRCGSKQPKLLMSPYQCFCWKFGYNVDPNLEGFSDQQLKLDRCELIKCFHLFETKKEAVEVFKQKMSLPYNKNRVIIPVYVKAKDIISKGNLIRFSGNNQWDRKHNSVGVRALTIKKEDVIKVLKEKRIK